MSTAKMVAPGKGRKRANTPVAKPGAAWKRIDGVDLLRGLAIFFVLMNHVNMRLLGAKVPYTHGLPSQLVYSLVWNGQQGVQMFFAVSGFLITTTSLRRWGSIGQVKLREFYQFRFARIGPLLLLLLAVLCTLHYASVSGFVVSSKTGGLGGALFAALTFHINLLEAQRGYLPGAWDILWSLSVEEVFYLFFPLACRLFRRGRYLLLPIVTLVIVGPFARSYAFNHNPVWREYSYLGGMDAIALGCLTALVCANPALVKNRFSRPALWALTGFGTALLVFILGFSIQTYKWGLGRNGLNMSLLAIGTCMLIAVFSQTHWRSPRLLSPLSLIGRLSYEIYLTHMFIALALFSLFLSIGKPMAAVPLLFLGVILFSGLLGWLVSRFYTEPLNRKLRGN